MEGMKVRREFRVPGRTKEEGEERERRKTTTTTTIDGTNPDFRP